MCRWILDVYSTWVDVPILGSLPVLTGVGLTFTYYPENLNNPAVHAVPINVMPGAPENMLFRWHRQEEFPTDRYGEWTLDKINK